MPYRAVIVDLFGTLVAFSAIEHRDMLRQMSIVLGISDVEAAPLWNKAYERQELGEPVDESIAWVCRSSDVEPSAEQTLQAARIWTDFQYRLVHSPRDDAVNTLNELLNVGFKIGLISNCPAEVPTLWQGSPLAPLVDAAVFSCDCRILKPDPRIYEEVCKQLRVEPLQCVFVGDGGSDELAGAEAVGMRAVLLAPGSNSPSDEPSQAEVGWAGCRISHLSELPHLMHRGH